MLIKTIWDFMVSSVSRTIVRTDSSSARQWLQRTGVGRLKHYHVRLMWTQALIQDGLVEVKAIATKLNIADLNTKKLSIGRRSFLMFFFKQFF